MSNCYEEGSNASSVLASNLTEHIDATFVRGQGKAPIAPEVREILSLILEATDSIQLLNALESAGYTSPAKIVSSFGGQPCVIACEIDKP